MLPLLRLLPLARTRIWSKKYSFGQISPGASYFHLKTTVSLARARGYSEWSWDLTISLVLYLDYRSLHRPSDSEDYVKLALDSGDDVYIENIVEALEEAAEERGLANTRL